MEDGDRPDDTAMCNLSATGKELVQPRYERDVLRRSAFFLRRVAARLSAAQPLPGTDGPGYFERTLARWLLVFSYTVILVVAIVAIF